MLCMKQGFVKKKSFLGFTVNIGCMTCICSDRIKEVLEHFFFMYIIPVCYIF